MKINNANLISGLALGFFVFSTLSLNPRFVEAHPKMNSRDKSEGIHKDPNIKKDKKQNNNANNHYRFCMSNLHLIDFREMAQDYQPKMENIHYQGYFENIISTKTKRKPNPSSKRNLEQEQAQNEEQKQIDRMFEWLNEIYIEEVPENASRIEFYEVKKEILNNIIERFSQVKDSDLVDYFIQEELCQKYQMLINIESNESI